MTLSKIMTGIQTEPFRLLLHGVEGVGKAQPLDAQILTPDGFVPMGTLHAGSEITGANGKPCHVIGVYPQGEKEVFKVTFRDGSTTRCCREHLWFTQTCSERDNGLNGAVRSLAEIQKHLIYGTRHNHQVPRVSPVHFRQQQEALPLNPWLLGMYLGDGHCDSCVSITNSEEDIRAKIAQTLPMGDVTSELEPEHVGKGLRIRREQRNNDPSETKKALLSLGLTTCQSNEKFIPPQYQFASIEDRLELLRGLFDSDGFVTKPGAIEYCTVSSQLAQDIVFLVRSLGGSAVTKEKNPTFTYRGEKRQGQKAYRIFASFPPEIIPVSSAKHRAKWKTAEWVIRHTIRSVEYEGIVPCQCIRVDAPDSLYVTDDFLVTHNSTFSACAPDPVFIQTEDGLGQIDVPKFPLAESFDSVMDSLNALLNEEHSYQTVVIDSVDWLEKLATYKVLEGFKGKTSLAEIDYGKGYAMLIPLFEAVIDRLNQLRREKKMNIVCVAHSKLEKIVDPTGASYDQYAPRLDKRINGLLREWCDLIIFATIEISRTTEKDGFKQRVIAKAVRDQSGNDRVLILESTPAIVAKSRYRLPVKMPLDGEAFFAALWSIIHTKQR